MNKQTIMTSVKALAACLVTASVLLFAFALVSLRSDDPCKNLTLYAYVAILVSAAIGGVMCTGADNKMIASLIFSGGFVLLSVTAGAMAGEIFTKPIYTLVCYLLVFIIPAAVALRSSGNKRRKNKSRKKFLRSRK